MAGDTTDHRTRCVDCAREFRADEIPEGTRACPNCGSTGVPMSTAWDTTIRINWHELRILCMWADNHAQQMPKNAQGDGARRSLAAIIRRIRAQGGEDAPPLTMRQEMQQVADYLESDVTVQRADGSTETLTPHPINPEE